MKFKTFAPFLAILLAFGAVGYAETATQKHEKKMAKLQQKLEKERAKRAERAEETGIKNQISRERSVSEQAQRKAEFGLSCPLGGYDRVVIQPALGNQFIYWRGGGATGVLFRRYVMVLRAKNPYTNMTVNITTASEPAVSNMCPGGIITLVQSMAPFDGGYYKRVIWTAEGMVDGRLAYGYSESGTLQQGWYNSEATANRSPWLMNLNRVDKKF